MRNLQFIQVVPGDGIRFWWELFVQLHNFRQFGYSELCRILIYIPIGQKIDARFYSLMARFPEAKFFVYKDPDGSVQRLIQAATYQPIIRLWCLKKHFEEYPELKDDTFFYQDSDIILLDKLNFESYIYNETNYVSDTRSYLNSDYFDSKLNDVAPAKLEQYKKRDILNECAEFSGITRQICEQNKDCTGGAQYILKNLDSKFFELCIESCMMIRNHLRAVNQQFMKGDTPIERENSGFQSWCADMWAILWNLWKRGDTTEIIKELDFLWATDEIKDIGHKKIYHNAGVTSSSKLVRKFGKETIETDAFFKGAYNSHSPFDDIRYIQSITENEASSLYCNSLYCKAILSTYKHYFK